MDDIILYIKNTKESTKTLLEIINEYGKVVGYKMNIQKSVAFLYTNNNAEDNPIYNGNNKNKTPRNKFNQGGERTVH